MSSKSKIILTPVKKSEHYDNWCYILKANVCAHDSVEDARAALVFLDQVADATVTEVMLLTGCPEQFQKLDMCLFLALITMLSSSVDGDQVLSRVRAQSEFGCGRQALRIIEKFYLHEQSRAKTKALQSLMDLKCGKIADLGAFLAKFVMLVNETDGIDPAMKIELLKRQLLRYNNLDAIFAVWKKEDFPSFESLLASLEEYAQERRGTEQVRHSHLTSGYGKCNWCKKEGHFLVDCPICAADVKAGRALSREDYQAQQNKGKGKGKGAYFNPKGAGKGKGGGKGGKGGQKGYGKKKKAAVSAEEEDPSWWDCWEEDGEWDYFGTLDGEDSVDPVTAAEDETDVAGAALQSLVYSRVADAIKSGNVSSSSELVPDRATRRANRRDELGSSSFH